jgi:hypothetical protein
MTTGNDWFFTSQADFEPMKFLAQETEVWA